MRRDDHGMVDNLPWYIARSAGLVGWALLSASVILGLTLSNRTGLGRLRPRPAWTLDLHRYLGGLATIFTAVHVVGVLADTYVGFSPVEVLVPFASDWRPWAVAWGTIGLYLLVAVELTSLARRQLPKRIWRAVHFASFPLFALATLHAFTAGTDTGSLLFVGTATLVTLVIAGLTALRVSVAMEEASATGLSPAPAPARPLAPASQVELPSRPPQR
jgi:predicted ferric reductase